jgi:integrase
MAEVYDRWHLSRPRKGAELCTEHSTKTKPVVAGKDHGKGKRWQVRWRDLNGKQCKENFEKRSKADTRAATIEADLARGQYVDPKAGRESFRAVAERWRAAAVHGDTTVPKVERALRLHIYPTFGDRPVASIQRSEVRAWVKDRSKVLKPSSLRGPYNVLTAVFKAAVYDGALRATPAHEIVLPDDRKPDLVPLEPEAVNALVAATPDRYRAAVLLAAASGLRQGEVFGIEVGHVNFLRRTVRVAQQLVKPDKGVPYIGEPKTHESYRTVPLAQSAVDALAAHLAQFPAAAVRVEDRTDAQKPKWRTARLVFVSERTDTIRRGSWAKVWARTVKRANAALAAAGSAVQVPADTTMHDLRHFYASLLIAAGQSPKTVQKRLGHAKPSITLDIYTHLWPKEDDGTAAIVEAVLGGVPSKCPVEVAR